METRRLGSLDVSIVGLGCNNFGSALDAAGTDAVIGAAIDHGITLLDTADIYGRTRSEEFMGKALAGRRDQVVLATKFGMKVDEGKEGAKPAYVRQAVEDSLRRLATDRIDLYQLHAPDPSTPIADTLAALDELVRAGKVVEIGCSNFSVAQLQEAEQAVADGAARFVSLQNEYSLLARQPDLGVLEECERQGLAFLPYFPLAGGMLTGKYRRGEQGPEGARLNAGRLGDRFRTDDNHDQVDALASFAESRGRTLLELAFSWLLSRPTVVSVIAGATKPEQVAANVGAASWAMDADELAEVDALAPVPAPA